MLITLAPRAKNEATSHWSPKPHVGDSSWS